MKANQSRAGVFRIRGLDDVRALEAQPYEELVPAQSVFELLANSCEQHSDRKALTVLGLDPEEEVARFTYRELLSEVTRAANLFGDLGVGPNDVVAIVSPVYAQVPTLLWGGQTAGVVSCINYLLSADALLELLRSENPRVLVCPGPEVDPELWGRLSRVIEGVESLHTVLVIGRVPETEKIRQLEPLLRAQPGAYLLSSRQIGRQDLGALFHTGGTTGSPKLVPHTHGNMVHAAWSFAQAFDITEHDVGLNGLPMFHVGGTSTWGLSILGAGGHVVVLTPTGFRNPAVVKNYWRLVERYQATMLGAVPTTIGALCEVPLNGCDISSVRMAQTGGAVLPAAVADRFEELTGVPLLEQYGMTETVATISSTPFHGPKLRGSAGIRCPFSDLAALQITGDGAYSRCEPGVPGIIACRGKQVFGGYVSPKHNEGAWTPDGWFLTGDLGFIDVDGYLHLTGRSKDLIIRSGHNIDPTSIEAVANHHPTVALSAVVGMPDAYAGEVPVVFVTPVAGKTVDESELARYLQVHVDEPPARPRHIFILDTMPVTAVGKIFKPRLRELAMEAKFLGDVKGLGLGVHLQKVCFEASAGARVTLVLKESDTDPCDRSQVEARLHALFRDLTFQVELLWT